MKKLFFAAVLIVICSVFGSCSYGATRAMVISGEFPDGAVNKSYNSFNDVTCNYVGSEMRTKNLARAKALITATFGASHILTHRDYLHNAVKDGKPSGVAWFDCTVELMTEQMVYGGRIFRVGNDGQSVPILYTMSKSQLPLFQHRPDMESTRSGWYWLRDIVSGVRFAAVTSIGNANIAVLPILAAVCVLIHFRAFSSFVLAHGLREGRVILSVAKRINTNRYGAGYD